MERKSVLLPADVWRQLDRLAEMAGATASRGRAAGETSWRVLLRRIGEDPELFERLAKYFAAGPMRSNTAFGETIIRPVQPVCETIARISVSGQTVAVRFPEKRDDFREVVKGYGCLWESPRWERALDSLAGDPADRAAELGHRLLAAGFCVVLPSATIQQMAISGSYAPECRRWILAATGGQYKDHFILRWRYSEDCYAAASRISGSRYVKPDVVVPPEHVEEVLDFAEIERFQLTEAAQALAEQARAWRLSDLVVEVPALDEAQAGSLFDFTIPDEVEVDDELADDPL